MHKGLFSVAGALALAGCASVTAVPLNPATMKANSDAEPGIRYYMPKPYLLVAELPEAAAPPPSDNASGSGSGSGKGKGSGTGSGSGSGSGDASSQPTATASAPTAGATDTSFAAAIASYSVKIIYLPDYSQPMALKARSGLFGTVSVTPALQDGWMLTGTAESIDSGGAATLSSIASLVTAAAGGAAGGGRAGNSNADPTAAAQKVLKKTGLLDAAHIAAVKPLLAAAQNDASNLPALQNALRADHLSEPQIDDVDKALSMGATAGSGSDGTTVTKLAVWGKNVLAPGLYEFRYAKDSGYFQGFYPVQLFCGSGIVQVKPMTEGGAWDGTPPPGASCKSARP